MIYCKNCKWLKTVSEVWPEPSRYCRAPQVRIKRIVNNYFAHAKIEDIPYAKDINNNNSCPYFERKVDFWARLFNL